MKILHVNGASAGGGLEQYLAQLFEELDKRGHTNLFLYGEKGKVKQPFLRAEEFYIKNIASYHCEHLKSRLKDVEQIINNENPDLVYIHQVSNFPLLKLLTQKKPSVRFVHGFKLVCPEGKKTLQTKNTLCRFPLSYLCQIHAYQYRCMPRNPFLGIPMIDNCKKTLYLHKSRSAIVVASDFMKSVLLRNGFPKDRISVIPYFTHLPNLANYPDTNSKNFILALGRLIPAKGFHHLITAFSKVNGRLQLVILGDGPALKDLKALVTALREQRRVFFPGWISHDKLDSFYRNCSMVVIPSTWPEPFGIIGIEAMAYQKPVIAFDVGGISHWLKDGETGFLVNSGDENALAKKISFLKDRPNLASLMGIKARTNVQSQFTPEIHMKCLIDIFEHEISSFQMGT